MTTGAALPGVGADDRRVPVDARVMPWAALVRLQVPGVSRCTAFLIDPKTAVTAAHCLYGRALGRFVPAGSVHLLVGYDRGRYAGHQVAASYAVMPGYDPAAGAQAGVMDLAMVHLAQPAGALSRTLPLMEDAPAPGTPLMLGGYGQDRAEALLADTACQVTGYAGADAAAMLVHDCEGARGTSGAPVLARDKDGRWRVAGVQATGRADAAGGTAIPAGRIRALEGR